MMVGSLVGIAVVVVVGVQDALSRAEDQPIELDTCCTTDGAPRRAPSATVPAQLGGGDTERGRATYVALCANCHDDDGSGQRGRPSHPSIRPLADAAPDPAALAEAVVHGRGTMPAFGGLIADAELRDLLAHVHVIRGADPPP